MRLSAYYGLALVGACWLVLACAAGAGAAESYPASFVAKYCADCHGDGEESEGDVNLRTLLRSKSPDRFATWERAVELVRQRSMPPDDAPQPSEAERTQLAHWFEQRLSAEVPAHPGFFRPRRLSAHEIRNTLASLFGFDLEVAIIEAEQTVAEKSLVMKLLPTDPPGPSGFTNDTSANPLTVVLFDQLAYLADTALAELFSPERKETLAIYSGTVEGELTPAVAERILLGFAEQAYRRPVAPGALARGRKSFGDKRGKVLERALRQELQAILMSPKFLYRGLLLEVPADQVVRVDAFELAERLSYFLWGDMPDDALRESAGSGDLLRDEGLRAQVVRMLASPKARNLAEDLGGQWFSLGEIEKASNNPPIAHALLTQPQDFLHYLFTQDRPLLELIDSQVTFINSHTAKYYPEARKQLARYRKQKGIEIEARPNERVMLPETSRRGGLLTMPGVLAMNRGPILRGTWILERILGDELPEPPPDVGQVPASPPGESLTFRQRFELHRANPTCAVCHDKIDPLGFALQRYDSQGAYRVKKDERRKRKRVDRTYETDPSAVETRGRLPTGETFDDFEGLREILRTSQRQAVVRNIVRRTLAYALCRKLEVHDFQTVRQLTEELAGEQATFTDLIMGIVTSLPFQNTEVGKTPRGEPNELAN